MKSSSLCFFSAGVMVANASCVSEKHPIVAAILFVLCVVLVFIGENKVQKEETK